MAAYAALLSLAQTTDLTANQDNQYRFSFDAESKIRSIHEYVYFLLSFLENSPKEATRWEDRVREVAHKIEDIIQHYMWQQMKSMKPSTETFERQLKTITAEIGLIVGQMMEERPAYLSDAAVSVSSPANMGKDAVIGLQDDVKAIKDRLCGHSSKLQVVPIVGMGGIDVWDDLRYIFPNDNTGSRIMLTTRLSDLATYLDFGGPLHEMRFMDDHQSWDLLKQKVFTNSNNFPSELEDVGKEIARKCAGLPLAVVLVAGVLSAANTTQASWEEIARSTNLVVKEELKEILSFSYTHLPHHLRPCFLYIGGFPEDEEIHASRLIKLWVAEGFLKHQFNQFGYSKSLEDEAEVYLDDLVKRNLVLVNTRKSNGKIKSCSLHDTVRDMCVRKAREEKFLRVLDGCDLPQGLMNERRISVNHSDINGILGPTIRSILCFQLQSFPGWEAFLGSSTLLKVLNGVGSSGEDQPPIISQVFDLFHLTHLVLIGSFNIPSGISNLVNLQTLIIHPTFRQKKKNWEVYDKNASHFLLPLEIWRMRQLRHLILYDRYMLPSPPNGSNLPLEKLQTLSTLENLVWSERMVQMIPNVKKLGLLYLSNENYHLLHLNCLHQLEKLQIKSFYLFWQNHNCAFSTTLQKLSLVSLKFPWEDMGIIGSLPNLQVLKLLNHACVGETWETDDDKFPQLKFLLIDRSRLRQWTTQGSSSFPMLRCLVLRYCWYLKEIPESIGEIPTLELIEVYSCTRSIAESVEQIRKDQHSYGNDALRVVDHSNKILIYVRNAIQIGRGGGRRPIRRMGGGDGGSSSPSFISSLLNNGGGFIKFDYLSVEREIELLRLLDHDKQVEKEQKNQIHLKNLQEAAIHGSVQLLSQIQRENPQFFRSSEISSLPEKAIKIAEFERVVGASFGGGEEKCDDGERADLGGFFDVQRSRWGRAEPASSGGDQGQGGGSGGAAVGGARGGDGVDWRRRELFASREKMIGWWIGRIRMETLFYTLQLPRNRLRFLADRIPLRVFKNNIADTFIAHHEDFGFKVCDAAEGNECASAKHYWNNSWKLGAVQQCQMEHYRRLLLQNL
ncbi:hypothetical protein C2S53_012232 [Perilla frutescens var. hirtella]|uniref:NB-ARC domain-containing protein n=1 Tax=Perilla frutescens var. hirtella TaxID=608512 RepID=A0AAD4P4U6_PERFH|nr:hypothetical protein C2S53_012232 [Perilla frutescens var. hirtella]